MGICVVVTAAQRVPGRRSPTVRVRPRVRRRGNLAVPDAAFMHATGGTFGIMHILLNM